MGTPARELYMKTQLWVGVNPQWITIHKREMGRGGRERERERGCLFYLTYLIHSKGVWSACVRAHKYTHTHTHTHTHAHTHVHTHTHAHTRTHTHTCPA